MKRTVQILANLPPPSPPWLHAGPQSRSVADNGVHPVARPDLPVERASPLGVVAPIGGSKLHLEGWDRAGIGGRELRHTRRRPPFVDHVAGLSEHPEIIVGGIKPQGSVLEPIESVIRAQQDAVAHVIDRFRPPWRNGLCDN